MQMEKIYDYIAYCNDNEITSIKLETFCNKFGVYKISLKQFSENEKSIKYNISFRFNGREEKCVGYKCIKNNQIYVLLDSLDFTRKIEIEYLE